MGNADQIDHATVMTLCRLLLREPGISGAVEQALRMEFSRVLKDRARRQAEIAPDMFSQDVHKQACQPRSATI